MVGTIVAAGLAAGASIWGGISKSNAARRQLRYNERMQRQMEAENDSWYRRYYNADATQFADNRRALTEARATLLRSNMASAGTSAVMGGTNAQAAAAKEANNRAYADAVSGVAAAAQQRKDSIQDGYLKRRSEIEKMEIDRHNLESERNKAAIDAAVGAVQSAASVVASADAGGGAKSAGGTNSAAGNELANSSNMVAANTNNAVKTDLSKILGLKK